jgi:hypothetical protein
MTNTAMTIVAGALLVGVSSIAPAQTPSRDAGAASKPAADPKPAATAPAAPNPPAELDALFKGYAGSWTCDTTYPAGSMGPGTPETRTRSTVSFRKDLGGMWYRGDYDTRRTKATPPFRGIFYLGYDPTMKAALLGGVDSMGSVSMAVAPAAAGDTITFTGEAFLPGQKVKTRETMSRKGPRELEHRYEVDTGNGLQVMVIDVCKK